MPACIPETQTLVKYDVMLLFLHTGEKNAYFIYPPSTAAITCPV